MPIAIGDIHGCLEPLQALVAQLPAGEELVFLGDYVDRGPDSAGVIRYLKALATQRPCRFLMGNHEWLMLSAVVDSKAINHWLANGGATTLESYGVNLGLWMRSSDRGAFLEADREFFSALPLYWQDERTIFVHAGIDIAIPEMDAQDPEVLIWIRERFFLNGEHWKGKEVIFGHTPTQTMGLPAKRIYQSHRFHGIDTGCVYGGYLTALDSRTHALYQQPGPR
jgi:serine/threonine protein phosphatase 1